MKTITIDTAALATIVQELAAETIAGVGTLFLNGRAEGVSSLHRRLLQLARPPAPVASLANHPDVIGPVAWHHQLPAGEVFIDGGGNGRPFESLKHALEHLDEHGGTLEPLFKLREFTGAAPRAPGAGTAVKAAGARIGAGSRPALKLVAAGAGDADYDLYATTCPARGVLPCSREAFALEYGCAEVRP